MDQLVVERSVSIAAPRERVWQAITEPAELARWLAPNIPGVEMKRNETGAITVGFGPMDVDLLALEAVDPPHQATWRGLPDRALAVTFTLDREKDGTQVKVKMTGFESLPEEARQDRVAQSGAAWEKALANLNASLEGREPAFPQAYVAPLFGYWREPKPEIALERSIWIDAPRQKVWRALTDPAQFEQWFSPGTPWTLTALQVGGRLYHHNSETNTDMYVQVIDVLDPPHHLVVRSVPEPPATDPEITRYRLEEENGGTRLTLTYSGFELKPDDARWALMEQHTFGFGMMLSNIKAQVEGKPLPIPGGF